jgi:hypothetical protein
MITANYPRCKEHAALIAAAQAVVAEHEGVLTRALVFEVETAPNEFAAWAGCAVPITPVPDELLNLTGTMASWVDDSDDASVDELLELFDLDNFFTLQDFEEGISLSQSMRRLAAVRRGLEILTSYGGVWQTVKEHLLNHGVVTEMQLRYYFENRGEPVIPHATGKTTEALT